MTNEEQIKSLKFQLESSKLRHTEKDMEISRLKKAVEDKDRIIDGYQRFIRDNLHNARAE